MQPHLSRFVTAPDLAAVARDLGRLCVLFAVVLVVPCAVAVVHGEWLEALAFGATAAGTAAVGRFSRWFEAEDLSLGDALLVCALGYLGAATLGAIPLMPHLGPIGGLFEAMSGITTTGLSVYPADAMADMPRSVAFYRSWLQFLGGAGIVSISLAVFLLPGGAARELAIGERGGALGVASVLSASRVFFAIYALITGAVWLGYVGGGMGFLDATIHAMSTTSTGGFSPRAESIAAFAGHPVVPVVACVGMLAGAVSLPLYVAAWREGPGAFARDVQVRALVVSCAVAAALLAWTEGSVGRGLFHAISAATTTGFSTTDPAGWSDAGKLVAIPAMLIGSPTNSSAGGFKLLRVIVLLAAVRTAVWRALLPADARVPLSVRGITLTDRDLWALIAAVGMYLGLFLVGALALALEGIPAIDALFESASALATTGLSAGATLEASPVGLLVLTGLMWAGRLETLPVLVLVYRVGLWAARLRRPS